jgi:hypothetical protein
MRTFMLVVFWLSVVKLACRLSLLSLGDYPRSITTSAAEDVLAAVFAAALLVWAGSLLWGQP